MQIAQVTVSGLLKASLKFSAEREKPVIRVQYKYAGDYRNALIIITSNGKKVIFIQEGQKTAAFLQALGISKNDKMISYDRISRIGADVYYIVPTKGRSLLYSPQA